MNKKRKIAYINGRVHLLKPLEENGKGIIFYSWGKIISIKGAYDLVIRQRPYEIIGIDNYVAERLKQRARERGEDITFKLEEIIK